MRFAIPTGALLGAAVALALLAGSSSGDRLRAPAAGATKPQLGVVPQRVQLEVAETQLMADAGVDSVRFWLAWSAVEATRDTYEWGSTDAIVRAASTAGLETLPFLFGSPEWAAHRDRRSCEGHGCIPYAPASIETRYAFAHFAAAAVRRYGPGGGFWEENPELPYRPITVWQVWNEQNSESLYEPDADPRAYAALLRIVAAEIRAVDPQAEILLGGMFGKRSTSRLIATPRYLRELLRVAGIESSFDGIAVHPYDPRLRGVIDQTRAVRALIRERGLDVDLWITEVGWASSGQRSQNLVKGRLGQARMLRRALTRLLARAGRWNLRAVHWYAWRDTPPEEAICAWCPGAGLLSVDGEPKPAYRRLSRLAGSR